MEKRIVIHVDDMGSSISANRAAFSLLQNGHASSGSIMVPGNWFSDIIEQTNKIQDMDLWIHLTLTSERGDEERKRKPTLPRFEVPSLVDANWYFWPNIDDVLHKANAEEIRRETMNQIIIAQESGINISHIDSHMWVLLHKELFPIYQELAMVFNIQPFIAFSKPWEKKGNRFYDCDTHINNLKTHWFKVFDNLDANSLYHWEKQYNLHCRERITSVKQWTTYFLIHALDENTSDRDKTPDYQARQNEYVFFSSWEGRALLESEGIEKISMKNL